MSVIIVSYNTRDQLRRCLTALGDVWETIVVDNASTDGSAAMVRTELPAVHLAALEQNIGFGPANNLGADRASGGLLLYLNSDAYVSPGAVARLAEVVGANGVVAAGPKLLNTDGSLQESVARRLTLGQIFWEQIGAAGRYWRTREVAESPAPVAVDQVMGACLMVRAGPERFDERFFLYCEDTDLCLRLSHHGRIMYVPDATVVHELGTSSQREPWRGIARYNRGKELYMRIHHGPMAQAMAWFLNRLGAKLRMLKWLTTGRWDMAATWWRVLTARTSTLDPR